jgi:transcriptional regulator of arginine metabolism
VNKRQRQRKILDIINAKRVATQGQLADELARLGLEATQSSVSRDIAELNLVKSNGYYSVPEATGNGTMGGPVLELDTAGDNLIVLKTEVGLAQPAAIVIDRAKLDEVVGTLAGDDTILIAVKNAAAQQVAIKKITRLFQTAPPRARAKRLKRAPGVAHSSR